jgi:hypothetical protein
MGQTPVSEYMQSVPLNSYRISSDFGSNSPLGEMPEQPPTTTISLDGTQGLNGYWVSDVEATLTAVDEIFGVNKTYYSFDNINWFIYNDPFMITSDGTTTVYYYSTNLGGLVEDTKSETINIDRNAPDTSVTLSGTQGNDNWWISEVRVTLSSTDDYSGVGVIAWSTDGVNWNNYDGPFNITIGGTTILRFNATDLAGNVETTDSVEFKIDNTPPVSNVVLLGTLQNEWYISDVSVLLGAVDDHSGVARIMYSMDGLTWFDYPGWLDITEDGSHTLYYNSSDVAGNSETPNSVVINIDRIAPHTTASITGTLGENGWYTSDVTIELTATDSGSGVDYISYRIESGSETIYGTPFTLSDEGSTTIYFKSYDVAGNIENEDSVTISIDKTPPSISINLDGLLNLNGWYVSDVTVSLTADDQVSGVYIIQYNDGNEWLTYSDPFIISLEGITELYYRAYDNAGNLVNKSQELKIDKTGPETTASVSGTIGLNNWYTTDVIIELSATDEASGVDYIYYWLNDYWHGHYISYDDPFTISVEGTTIIFFRAFDFAGNQGPDNQVTITIDKTAPSISASLDGLLNINGWYLTDVTVTLTGDDLTSGLDVIQYYSEAEWVNYSTPFTITTEGIMELSYRAIDFAGNINAKSQELKIDKTAPEVSATLLGTVGSNGWYTSDVIVELTATDDVSGVDYMYYWLNDYWYGDYITYDGPFTISDEGTTTIFYRAFNYGGNFTTESLELKIDKTAPETTASLSGTLGLNNWYISNVTIELTATDDISGVDYIVYRIEGGSETNYDASFNISIEGTTTIYFKAVDVAGNVEIEDSATFAIDKTPPSISADIVGLKGYQSWFRSDVTVSFTTDDGTSGVDVIQYNLAVEWVDYTNTFTISMEGIMELSYRAFDVAGNVETKSVELKIDKSAPVTTYVLTGTLGLNGWYTTDVTIELIGADDISGVGYTLYGIDIGKWTKYGMPFTISNEGNTTVHFKTYDIAGNAEPTNSLTIRIDKTPPVTTPKLTGTIGLNGWYTSDVTIELFANDAISGVDYTEYRIGMGTWLNYGTSFTISDEGNTTFYFRTTDIAGNVEATNSLTIRVDKTPPEITVEQEGIEGNDGWYLSDVVVNISASDTISGVDVIEYYDDGIWLTYSTPITITSEGTTNLLYQAFDKAGNIASGSVDLKIDKTPPTSSILLFGTSGLEGWFVSDVTAFPGANDYDSGVARITYSFDGSTWIDFTGSLDITEEGIHTLQYNASDLAGNSEEPNSLIIKIDKTSPETVMNTEGLQGLEDWFNSTVNISFISTDLHSGISQIYYRINGGEWNEYITDYVTLESEGQHSIEYYSIDVAGNEEDTISDSVKIDLTPPETTLIISGIEGLNGWFVSSVTLQLSSIDTQSGVSKIYYSFNGIYWGVYAGKPVGHKLMAPFTFYYYAVDKAGNTEETKIETILVDNHPPETNVTLDGELSSEGFYTSNVEVTMDSADDYSGVASTFYSLDEITWDEYLEPFWIEDEGNTTIWFYSNDTASNTEEPKNITIEIHKAAAKTFLTIDIYYEENGIIYVTSNSKFTLSTESQVARTYYRINGMDWIVYTDPFNLTGLDGVYVIDYFSTSLSGVNETINTAIVTLTNIHVDSFLTTLPSPPFRIKPVDSLEFIFVKRWNKDYKLVNTKPRHIWYNIWLDNYWPIDGDEVNITPHIPSDFEMDLLIVWINLRCHCQFPIYLYWNGTGRCPIVLDLDWISPLEVEFDGEMVTVSNLPAGGEVYVTIRTNYALRGLTIPSLDDFILENYVYSVSVEGSGGNPSEPGEGLLGTYSSCAEVTSERRASKGHKTFCKCFKNFGRKHKQGRHRYHR